MGVTILYALIPCFAACIEEEEEDGGIKKNLVLEDVGMEMLKQAVYSKTRDNNMHAAIYTIQMNAN